MGMTNYSERPTQFVVEMRPNGRNAYTVFISAEYVGRVFVTGLGPVEDGDRWLWEPAKIDAVDKDLLMPCGHSRTRHTGRELALFEMLTALGIGKAVPV